MSVRVKNNIHWVGKIDWELRKFHGDEYSTHRGSTYNSYLIKEKKIALIDTVWAPFSKEFVANLNKQVELAKTHKTRLPVTSSVASRHPHKRRPPGPCQCGLM